MVPFKMNGHYLLNDILYTLCICSRIQLGHSYNINLQLRNYNVRTSLNFTKRTVCMVYMEPHANCKDLPNRLATFKRPLCWAPIPSKCTFVFGKPTMLAHIVPSLTETPVITTVYTCNGQPRVLKKTTKCSFSLSLHLSL